VKDGIERSLKLMSKFTCGTNFRRILKDLIKPSSLKSPLPTIGQTNALISTDPMINTMFDEWCSRNQNIKCKYRKCSTCKWTWLNCKGFYHMADKMVKN
jgi:hypothetical protein